MIRVYLAGPAVFRPDAIEEGKRLKRLCKDRNLEGLFPLDNELPAGIPFDDTADWIKSANKDMIRLCSVVLAEVSPFRGPNMDPGTAYECGYAEALNKQVYYWTRDIRSLHARMGGREHDDEGRSIENFDLVENIMIAACPAIGPFSSADIALDLISVRFRTGNLDT
jgi:nucleoside 2-deoxyribosyltransferase